MKTYSRNIREMKEKETLQGNNSASKLSNLPLSLHGGSTRNN